MNYTTYAIRFNGSTTTLYVDGKPVAAGNPPRRLNRHERRKLAATKGGGK